MLPFFLRVHGTFRGPLELGGVFEMMNVVDAMKVIAIVIGTAAHTLRARGPTSPAGQE